MRKLIFRWCLMLVILATGFYGYSLMTKPAKLATLDHLPPLEVGDWVLRTGTESDSEIIRRVSHSKWSHIGIIVRTLPKILVVHATTDDGEPKKNQVIVSTLERFLSPELAQDGIIVRPLFLTRQEKNEVVTSVWKRIGQPFVLRSQEQPHLYCTTLLYEPIVKIHRQFKPKWQYLSAPLFEGKYLFPQSFADYPDTKIIYRSSDLHYDYR